MANISSNKIFDEDESMPYDDIEKLIGKYKTDWTVGDKLVSTLRDEDNVLSEILLIGGRINFIKSNVIFLVVI